MLADSNYCLNLRGARPVVGLCRVSRLQQHMLRIEEFLVRLKVSDVWNTYLLAGGNI